MNFKSNSFEAVLEYCAVALDLYRAAWSLEIVVGRKDEPTARGVAFLGAT